MCLYNFIKIILFFTKKYIGQIDYKNKRIIKKFFYSYIPFYFIKKREPYLYRYNNIYYLSNYDKVNICPIIKKIILKSDDNEIDITEIIKKYNNIELWIFLKNENLEGEIIDIKISKILKNYDYQLNVKDFLDKKIYELYE